MNAAVIAEAAIAREHSREGRHDRRHCHTLFRIAATLAQELGRAACFIQRGLVSRTDSIDHPMPPLKLRPCGQEGLDQLTGRLMSLDR